MTDSLLIPQALCIPNIPNILPFGRRSANTQIVPVVANIWKVFCAPANTQNIHAPLLNSAEGLSAGQTSLSTAVTAAPLQTLPCPVKTLHQRSEHSEHSAEHSEDVLPTFRSF